MNNRELLRSLCSRFDFSVQVCSSVKHDKKWVEHESKNCYDIWIITDGQIEIGMENSVFVLKKSDAFFFYPDKLYTARSISETCTFLFIRFDILLEKNTRPLDYFSLGGYVKAVEIANETRMMHDAFDAFKRDDALSPLFLKGCLILLVCAIARLKLNEPCAADMSGEKSPYLKLEKLLSFIALNIDQNLSVKTLAGYLCMSEKYFITFFKKITGVTPFVYITGLKLRRAMEYLNGQKYTVKEVAAKLGYSDQYTFSKAFKRYYGFPPSGVT